MSHSDQECVITFDQCNQFRALVDIVSNVLTTITFRVCPGEIQIDSIDSKSICMVQARLQCSKTSGPSHTFCIGAGTLEKVLRGAPLHYSLDLRTNPDESPDVVMHSYETITDSHEFKAVVPTLAETSEKVSLNDMEYEYVVETDLVMLRQTVKNAIALGAEDIIFEIMYPDGHANKKQRVDGDGDESDSSGTRTSVFRISSEGDAKISQTFVSTTQKNSNVIHTDMTNNVRLDASKLEPVFTASFCAEYLHKFFKSMERQMVTMKMSPNMPLVVKYPLSQGDSYIQFVLAAKVGD